MSLSVSASKNPLYSPFFFFKSDGFHPSKETADGKVSKKKKKMIQSDGCGMPAGHRTL